MTNKRINLKYIKRTKDIGNNKYLYNILLYLPFIFFSIATQKQNINKINKLICDSEIIITIIGTDRQRILSTEFNQTPSEILINGNKTNKTDYYVDDLKLGENNITIRFNETLTSCHKMFYRLSNITQITFNKFDFSGTDTANMFAYCNNLVSLDLRKFNASSVTNMPCMFLGCSKLTSLDLSNFDISSAKEVGDMFYGCSNLLSLNLSHFNASSITNMGHMFYGCSNLISLDLRNIKTSSVEYMDYMFYGCSNLISLDLRNFDTSSTKTMNNMFEGCSSLLSLDLSNFDTSFVENMDNMFEGCNDYLIYCINNNSKTTQLLNHIYDSSYLFKDKNDCSDICFSPNKKLIIDTKKCVYNCTGNFSFEYNNICYSSCPNGTHNISNNICIETNNINNITYNNCNDYFNNIAKINNNSNSQNDIIMNIQNELMNNKLDFCIENIIIKENKDLLIKDKNIIYQLTSTYNQNHNIYNNLSSINLNRCEKELRKNYSIDNNITLLILKIDIFENGILIPIIEYEVYNSKTKDQLNLNICQNMKIDINIPVNIDENNIFKYNSSNEYYNDICYSYTQNNADFILKDRRNEYINNNLSLCEKDCEYNNYDYDNKKVLCECFTKIKIASLSEIVINKDKLLRNFIDIKNIININVLKCLKEVFNKGRLILNLGFIIMCIIIIITSILSFLFKIKGYSNLKKRIYEIIRNKREKSHKNEIIKTKIKNNPIKKRKKMKMIEKDEKTSKSMKTSKIDIIQKNAKIDLKNTNKTILNKKNYNDFELNNLSYKKALKKDKRTYFQYYLSLLRMKHILIFSFYTYTDYNSKYIKIILFLFSFSLSFTINALFFNDTTLHKIYEDKGEYNFIYQIPNILYSTIISSFINIIIKIFVYKIYYFFYINFHISPFFLALFNMFLWNLYKFSNSSYY